LCCFIWLSPVQGFVGGIVLFYLAISSTRLYEWNCVVLCGYLQYKASWVELCCFIWLSPVQSFMSGIVLFYLAISRLSPEYQSGWQHLRLIFNVWKYCIW